MIFALNCPSLIIHSGSPARFTEHSSLKDFLDTKADFYNRPSFIERDPISIPHRFSRKQDIEIMGFWAAVLAWGQRPVILRKAAELIEHMDGTPYDFVRNHQESDLKRFLAFKHRTFNATDALYFLHFFHQYYKGNDSLEDAFVPGSTGLKPGGPAIPPTSMLSDFGIILLFILAAFAFVGVVLFVARLLRPHRPNVEKNSTYESGEEPVGNANVQFNIRFYVVALVFVLFDLELVFLFPWATVFGQERLIRETGGLWGWFALTEAVLFVAVLGLGLAYVWAKGYLDWVKPQPKLPMMETKVPPALYQRVNDRYKR